MELLVSVYYNVDELAGKPTEYGPSVAIWTTDPEQAQTVSSGKAVDYIPMDAKGHTIRPVSFTSKSNLFPINDLTAELCVALYTKTQSDGSTPDAGKNRPFTLAAGQVSIPWSFIVRFLISNGNAYLAKNPSEEETTSTRSFPMATIVEQLSSLVVAEGVAYEIQMRQQAGDNSAVTAELKRLGPDSLSKKGELKILATLLAVSDKATSMTLRERLDITEQYYVASAPGFRDRKDKKERLKLGHIHASDMVKASQNYDKLSSAENKAFATAMTRYRQFYDSLWLATGERSGKKLIVFDTTGDKQILFKPDVPSMARFHLPLWVNGNDLIPYAEWWLRTLPEHATHMPKATEMTEQFLATLAVMAFKRLDIEPKKFVKVVGQVSHRAVDTPTTKLQRFLVVGTKQRNNFIKCTELVFYTVMMVAHAIRYSGDGRYVKILKQYLRLDVECPQHDSVSGTADDADCEDMATVIAIFASLLILGRQGGDSKTGGRGWSDPVLSMMRRVLQMYCDFNVFGSVRGRQLSDADGKEAPDEDDEGIIGSVDDVREEIGGHSFVIQKSLPEVAQRYEDAKHIVDAIVGYSMSDRIKKFVMGILRGWLGEVSADSTSPLSELLYTIWKSAPSAVLEGTGRQEPMLMSLEHYFGLGTEFLQRVAKHASEIDILERWPKEKPVEKKKKHHSHHSYSSEEDRIKSQAIKSMGEASPYMFQKRLTIRSMTKNDNQRHLSAFYRRLVHSVSSRLHVIAPEAFVHLIWIDPKRLTYGATLRSAIEMGGSAIPIPLSPKLHKQYLTEYSHYADDAELFPNGGKTFADDLFSKRMRRIIPFDLSFQHLEQSNEPKSDVTTPVASTSTLWTDATEAHKGRVEETIPAVYQLSQSNHGKYHSDFFCMSQVEISDSLNTPSNADSAAQQSSSSVLFPSSQARQTGDALVLTVPSDSAVATAIRNVAGANTQALLVPNVRSCMVTRPMNGIIQPIGSNSLANHVNSGAGVKQTQVYSERVFPWLADNLCAHFTRDVKFIIDDKVKSSSPNNIPVTSRARSGNNIPRNLDERHEETLQYMRFDVNQPHH